MFEGLEVRLRLEEGVEESIGVKGRGGRGECRREMLKKWRKEGVVMMMKDKG